MKFRTLGSSDNALKVPIVCLGTMTWGQQNTEEEAFAQLDYALERGVNFIDTAEMYPVPPCAETANRTEIIIGRWLAARGCRDKVILATKVSGPGGHLVHITAKRLEPEAPVSECQPPNLDEANIRAAVAASLRRLQTDFIDLYQVHWPSRYVPKFGFRQYKQGSEVPCVELEETVRTMGALIAEGKVKYWGLSNETTFGTCRIHELCAKLGVPPPVSIQNDFSLVYRHFEEELAEASHHYAMPLLAYGSLAGGTLSGKYFNGNMPAEGRHTLFPRFQPRYRQPRTLAAAQKYAALAKSKGMSPTTLAYAWAASRWFMGSVIIGATTLEQLKESIDAFEVELDQETLDAIDAIHVEHRNPNALD